MQVGCKEDWCKVCMLYDLLQWMTAVGDFQLMQYVVNSLIKACLGFPTCPSLSLYNYPYLIVRHQPSPVLTIFIAE